MRATPSCRTNRGLAAVGALCALLSVVFTSLAPASPARAEVMSFGAGSLVVPMDTSGSVNQNVGALRAYGLVYELLRNGVPVQWAIDPGKAINGDDFRLQSQVVKDVRSGAAVALPRSYRGGPFVIRGSDRAAALPIVEAWQAQVGDQTAVHEIVAGSLEAPIAKTLVAAPRIGVLLDGGEPIAFNDLNAAGIPDSNGNVWAAASGDVLGEAELAGPSGLDDRDGALFGAGGLSRFCQLVSMHYFATSLTSRVVDEVRSWLGTDSLAHAFMQCEAIEVFENDPAGRFLTTQGVVDDGAAPSLSVLRLPADPLSQIDGSFSSDSGAVDSIGLAAGSSLKPGVRVLINNAASPLLERMVLLSGSMDGDAHNGKVTYLAGHDYSTALPISSNPQTNGTRLFLNSLFEALCASTIVQDDVSLTLSGPETTTASSVTYTLNYTNPGPRSVEHVRIAEALPAGATFVSATAGGTHSGGVVRWNLGTLAADASGSVEVTVQLAGDGTYSHDATVEYTHLTVHKHTSNTITTIREVNDAPVLDASKSPTLPMVLEDAGSPLGAAGAQISDLVDFAVPSGELDSVTDPDLDALLGMAIIDVEGNVSCFFSTDDGSTWSPLGLVSQTNARLLAASPDHRIYCRAAANVNGTFTSALRFRAWDRTSGADGGLADTSTSGGTSPFSAATDGIQLPVTAVNDAPAGSDGSVTADEDSTYTFKLADFGFSDPTDAPAENTLEAIKVTTTATAGTLIDGMTALADGAIVARQDILDGKLTFAPASDANGAGYSSLTFQVRDNGGVAHNGVDLDGSPNTLTINVAAVNDAPVVTADVTSSQAQYSDPISKVTLRATRDADSPASSVTASVTGWKEQGAGTFTTPSVAQPALGGLTLAQVGATTPASFPLRWELSGRALVRDGTYIVRVAVTDGVTPSTVDIAIQVTKENASIEYSGDSFKPTASATTSTATLNLAAVVREAGAVGAPASSDSTLGDKLNTTQLRFTIYNFGGGQVGSPCTANVIAGAEPGTGSVTAGCSVTLPAADPYTVKVEQLVNGYYAAGVETAAVTVALPGTGATSGGGWLHEPHIGSRSNLGFTVKRLKNGSVQGNSVYIYRKTINADSVKYGADYVPAGDYNWQIKSNSWQGGGLSINASCKTTSVPFTNCTATFSGKANVTAISRRTGFAYALAGNFNYRVDVKDNGEPGANPAATPDSYGIKVWSDTTGTYYQLFNPPTQPPSTSFPQLNLNGGNVQVRP